MSMKDLNRRLEKLFRSKRLTREEFDKIFEEFQPRLVNAWRNLSNGTKNTLLHELVEHNCLDVVRHLISKYQLRTFFKRESDGLTPLQLAHEKNYSQMKDLLMEFTDDKTSNEINEQSLTKEEKEKMMNIVWMDLEFSSFENPQILECAVIITDKDLQQIERSKT